MKVLRFGLLALILPAVALLHSGCEIDSSDTFSRDVSIDFSGYYTGCNAGPLVAPNSGRQINSMDLRQSGDSLEAVDNTGGIWRGSLGEPQNGRSSFELKGNAPGGGQAWFSGSISSSNGGSTNSASSATGSMTGTYIEADRYSTFCGTATIAGSQPEPEPTPTNTVPTVEVTPP